MAITSNRAACPICGLAKEQRIDVERVMLARVLPWTEVARMARCSRRAVTNHSIHMLDALYDEIQSPTNVIYAPTINMVSPTSEAEENIAPPPPRGGDIRDG
jgi:hypothetical protein